MARDGRLGRPPEVRLVAARHDPDLERRARARTGRTRRVPASSQTSALRRSRLLANEPAARALPLADHEARRAAELLGDPVRDLGQVVQVEAQVVGPRAGLRRPSSGRPGGSRSGRSAVASAMASRASVSSASMSSFPTAWSGRCSPGGATIVRQLPVARACASETCARPSRPARALLLGADDVERVVA